MSTQYRTCTKCGVNKPFTPKFFKRRFSHSDTLLASKCKECDKIYNKEVHNSPVKYDTYAERLSVHYLVRRDETDQELLNVACDHCGEYFAPVANRVSGRLASMAKNKNTALLYCSDECKRMPDKINDKNLYLPILFEEADDEEIDEPLYDSDDSEPLDDSDDNEYEEETTLLYVIACNESDYKIGLTKNSVRMRIKALQTGNPSIIREVYEIRSVHTVITQLETLLHKLHKDKHISGEWFRLDTTDIAGIIEISKVIVQQNRDAFVRGFARQVNE